MTNKVVRNATPNEFDGIKFRSRLETYTYKKLKEAQIVAEYENNRYTLLPKFEFGGEKIRAITYKPDFVGDGFVIECKGHATKDFPLRAKLFQFLLSHTQPETKFYVVHNQKEVNSIIEIIKQNINQKTLQEHVSKNQNKEETHPIYTLSSTNTRTTCRNAG